jgi:hypothetical protein
LFTYVKPSKTRALKIVTLVALIVLLPSTYSKKASPFEKGTLESAGEPFVG